MWLPLVAVTWAGGHRGRPYSGADGRHGFIRAAHERDDVGDRDGVAFLKAQAIQDAAGRCLDFHVDLVGRDFGDRIALRFGARTRTGVRHRTYAEVPTGEVGLVVDSYGLVSIAIDRASAAEELSLGTGVEVVLTPIGDDDRPRGTSTPVTLREKQP